MAATLHNIFELSDRISSELGTTNTCAPIALSAHGTGKPLTRLGLSLKDGVSPPETPEEVQRVRDALSVISSDVGRGNGTIPDPQRGSYGDYWLAVVWAIASLNWPSGKYIAEDWSKRSPRYDAQGFATAWNSYKPNHPNPISIRSLYSLARSLGWQGGGAKAPVSITTAYKLLGRAEIMALPSTSWRVKHLLPETGIAALYGPSGSGKSFLAIDVAMAIANGADWFGHRTSSCSVTYIMLEAEGGLKGRIEAWEKQNGVPVPQNFKAIIQPFHLTDPENLAALSAILPPTGVIFIDTLNRAAPKADENSSHDMGLILEALKSLQRTTGGLIVLVHHTGKDTSRGMRGHSSLHAALDGAIEVKRTVDDRSWTAAKVKDGEDGKNQPFTLSRHILGQDADGEDISSCAIQQGTGAAIFKSLPPSGKQQQAALAVVRSAIASSMDVGKCSSGTKPCLKVSNAIALVSGSLATVEPKRRSNRARKLVGDLTNSHHLKSGIDSNSEGWVWLP